MKRALTIISALLLCCCASAQNERHEVRRGNRQFKGEKYQECEISYKKAILADSLSSHAKYNLGNTYYRMENFAEADKAFAAAQDSLMKPSDIARKYHNMGNSMAKQQNWQGAVDAYKNALRRNPGDMETKANLAYAQKMLQNQQQNQDNDQNQDNNQDQNRNNDQNQDQNQNNDQNKNDQNDDRNDQNDRNQNQNQNDNGSGDNQRDGQAPPPKISQQDARQMLQAIQDKEKDTQDKVKKEKALLLQSKQKEKNW